MRALAHALAQDKLHHALLFSGTRGVGKTTLARIIAKCLNCDRGVTAEPCIGDSACGTCREIDEGRFVDLIEVDAASRTGVDDTRDLMDNVQYAPTRGRTKVYLIDEVHMLSKHSFNALLKTLEEPPPRVQFLLATTEPEKIPVTILSRCLQFPLKRLPVSEIAGQIRHILDVEQHPAEDAAIEEIARAADGSMRDGLSLLDQAIAFGGGQLAVDDVRDMLGTIGQARVAQVVESIVNADAAAALDALAGLYTQGIEVRYLLEALATAWQEIATIQLIGSNGQDGQTHWVQLAPRVQPADVQVFYDITLAGLRDLPYAPDPLVGARMTVLRMLAFTPATATNAAEPPASASRRQAQPLNTASGAAPAVEKPEQPEVAPAPAGLPAQDGTPSRPRDWHSLVPRLALFGMAAQLAQNGVCERIDDDVVTLELARSHEHLATDNARDKLQDALVKAWHPDAAPKLRIQVVDAADDSPAQRAEQAADARQREAERSIENDPTVRQLRERLGAEVRTDTIKPNDPP